MTGWAKRVRVKCLVAATEVDQAPYDHRMLADAAAQLSNVVHSRQQGLEFGELFSHIIFGAITVVLTLLSPPAVTGWIGFLLEMLMALFSVVIVFLAVNVGFTPGPGRQDFEKERGIQRLRRGFSETRSIAS